MQTQCLQNRLLQELDQAIKACDPSDADAEYINDILQQLEDAKVQIASMSEPGQLDNPHIQASHVNRLENFLSWIEIKQPEIYTVGLTQPNQALFYSLFKSIQGAVIKVLTHLRIKVITKSTAAPVSYIEHQIQKHIVRQQEKLNTFEAFRAFLETIKNRRRGLNYKVPSCFICYAWPAESNPKEHWVQPFLKQFRTDLMDAGVKVELDVASIVYGGDGSQYMKDGIQKSDFVLLIGSESMFLKSQQGLKHVVNTEINLIVTKASKSKSKPHPYKYPVIPLLLSGTMKTAFPYAFHGMDIVKRTFMPKGYLVILKELLMHIYVMEGQADIKAQWEALQDQVRVHPTLSGMFKPSKASILLGYSKALIAGNTQSLRDYLRDCGEDPHMSFEGGDFQEINLTGGDISGFNFKNAKLNLANLTSVKMTGTELEGADLSQCIGLKAEIPAQARLPHFDQGHSIQPHAYPGDGGGGGGGAKADEPIVSSDNLTQTLKQAYSQHNGITVPFEDVPIPFSELYTQLQLKGKVGFTQCEANEGIAFSALGLARDSHGKAISRRWIEGVAGTGKTTLVKRILHRWADPETAKASEPFLVQYQAVLYLPLRHILPLFEKREEPYQYQDLLDKSRQWQHHTLMNRGSQFNAASLSQLQLLLQHHPEQVLFLVDGLDEVDVNHSLLRDVLINPDKPHHFIITTRPQTIPPWLAPHINQEIVNCGFNHGARYKYVDTHFARKKDHYEKLFKAERIDYLPCTRALLILEKQKKTLRTWMEGQEHLDDCMNIPLNCHLICVAFSGSAAGRLPDHPTMTQLYDQLLIQWIKRALTKSSSMREHYGIETATELDILSAIDDQFSEQELLERSQSWIHNLEAIAFECIQDGDSISVSYDLIKGVIQAQNLDWSHKQLIDRLKELIIFGILSYRGLTRDEPQDTDIYEYTHKTFLEYMAGRFIACHFTGQAEDNPYHQAIESLLFDPKTEEGPGFYQPKYSLLLRFASGAMDQRVQQRLQTKKKLTLWVSKLLEAYQRDLWGSGALLQVFSCLVEMEQDWMLEAPCDRAHEPSASNSGHGGGGGAKDTEQAIKTISSMKMMIMSMLWRYVAAHQKMGEDHLFDASLTRLWRMACLQITRHIKAASIKPRRYSAKSTSITYPSYEDDYAALQAMIKNDARASADPQLQVQANKALELMGNAHCTFEPTKKTTYIPPYKQRWVQVCLGAGKDLANCMEQFLFVRSVVPLFTNLNPLEIEVFKPYYIDLHIQSMGQYIVNQIGNLNVLRESIFIQLVAETFVITIFNDDLQNQITTKMIAQLDHQKFDYRVIAVQALVNISQQITNDELKLQIIKGLIKQCAANKDWGVGNVIVKAFGQLVPLIKQSEATLQTQIIEELMKQLQSEQLWTRNAAAHALGQLAFVIKQSRVKLPSKVIQELIQQLQDEDKIVCGRAAGMLGQLIPVIQDSEAIPLRRVIKKLIQQLQDEDKIVCCHAAHMLGKLAPVIKQSGVKLAPRLIEELLKQLQDEDTEIIDAAAYVLDWLTPIIMQSEVLLKDCIIVELTKWLNQEEWSTKCDAAYALSHLALLIVQSKATLQAKVIEALITGLQNDDEDVRRSAAYALGHLVPSIEHHEATLQIKVIEELMKQLQDNNGDVKSTAAEALGQLMPVVLQQSASGFQEEILGRLIDFLKYSEPGARQVIIYVLVAMAPFIKSLNQDAQNRLISNLFAYLSNDGNKAMHQLAIETLKTSKISVPRDHGADTEAGDSKKTKTLLIKALKANKDEVDITSDMLFSFVQQSEQGSNAQQSLSFEELKVHVQWLVICTSYPSPCIQIQAYANLMTYQKSLQHYLALETLFKGPFQQDLVDTSLKIFLISWRLPSTIYSPLEKQFQTIGKESESSQSVDDYRQAFHQLKPAFVQKGERLLLGFTQALQPMVVAEAKKSTQPEIVEAKIDIARVRPVQSTPTMPNQSATLWPKASAKEGEHLPAPHEVHHDEADEQSRSCTSREKCCVIQ